LVPRRDSGVRAGVAWAIGVPIAPPKRAKAIVLANSVLVFIIVELINQVMLGERQSIVVLSIE
jgi:hypothetical protein